MNDMYNAKKRIENGRVVVEFDCGICEGEGEIYCKIDKKTYNCRDCTNGRVTLVEPSLSSMPPTVPPMPPINK